jgi:hypothetical protein
MGAPREGLSQPLLFGPFVAAGLLLAVRVIGVASSSFALANLVPAGYISVVRD